MVDKKIEFPLCGFNIGLEKVSQVLLFSVHMKFSSPHVLLCCNSEKECL